MPLLSAWPSEYEKDHSPVQQTAVSEEKIPRVKQPQPQLQAPASPVSTLSTGSIFSEEDFPPLPSPSASPVPAVQHILQPEPVHSMVTRAKDGIWKPF